jgi:hypothetical protein
MDPDFEMRLAVRRSNSWSLPQIGPRWAWAPGWSAEGWAPGVGDVTGLCASALVAFVGFAPVLAPLARAWQPGWPVPLGPREHCACPVTAPVWAMNGINPAMVPDKEQQLP